MSEEQPLKPYPFQQKMIDDIRAAEAAGKPIRLKYKRHPGYLNYAIAAYLFFEWRKEAAKEKESDSR